MSEFYDEMYEVARELINEFGTLATLTSLDGAVSSDIRIVYLKPDRKRDDMPMGRTTITNSNQRRAIFQFAIRDVFVPERGCQITGNGKTMTIQSLKPVAPADIMVVYECLLEV